MISSTLVWLFGLPVLAAGGVLALCPPKYLPVRRPYDKVLHAAYCFVAVVVFRSLLPPDYGVIFLSLTVFTLGILGEVLQLLVPERSFSIQDLVANAAGIGGGLAVIA